MAIKGNAFETAPKSRTRVPTQDERVDQLAQELADEVHSAEAEDREELRAYATDVLRAETEHPGDTGAALRRRRQPFGPLGLALLLLLAGGLFAILLPPVGVVLLLTAAVAFVWGLVRLAVVWREPPPDPGPGA